MSNVLMGLIVLKMLIQTKAVNMEPRSECENEHDFVLVLAGVAEITDQIEDALFKAGCDDATISLRQGRVFLTFTRQAPSLSDAILSAVRDIRRAEIGADALRVVECDFVTQAEIARRTKRSRQLVHQYMTGKRGPGGFPSPICEITEKFPLWRWCEVANWLAENSLVEESVFRAAETVVAINAVLDLNHQRRSYPELVEKLLQMIGPFAN